MKITHIMAVNCKYVQNLHVNSAALSKNKFVEGVLYTFIQQYLFLLMKQISHTVF